jgi:hypothetical protein
MTILTRDALLKPVEVPREQVDLPELGGSVWVRGMTTAEKVEWHAQFQTSSGKPNKKRLAQIAQRLCVWCVCDENGQRILTDEDVEAIGQQRADVIERIASVAQRLCGMAGTGVEELAKNSDETSDGS